jgi:pyruvate carboxylase subunit A
LTTHFITTETTLLDDMRRIQERERPLEDKLTQVFEDKRRVAAIVAATQVAQAYLQSQKKSTPD